MRIAMISLHTSPIEQPGSGDAGGINVYVINIAKLLARRGVKVDIFTRATRPGEIVEVEDNLRVINIVAGPYEGLIKEELPTQLAAFAGGIINFVSCSGDTYDLIHSHYWLSGQVGWLLRELWNVPLVHTAHTLAAVKNLHRSAGDTVESDARQICEQQIADNADVMVVNTVAEQRDLVEHYDADPDKIVVVSPGADTALFTPGTDTDRMTQRARRLLGIPQHTKVIAFVGRLQKFKGPEVLIRAVAVMLGRTPHRDMRVIMCGGPSGQNSTPETYLNLAKELGVDRHIRFIPPRPAAELVAVYQAADIVAVPSYNETFGLVAIEAQASGTPVVATNAGGLSIAVADGETGLLVDGHDESDWADALEELLDDDARRIEMGRKAVEHAATYSWEASVDTLAEVYEKAVEIELPDCHSRRAAGY